MKNQGFGRILFATDGSNESQAAAHVTASIAHASSADVRVVNVWNLEVHERNGVWDVVTRGEAETLINEAVKRLRAAGVEADGELIRADSDRVAAAVAESARRFNADLVVVGSRGLSNWHSLIRHSVSHKLLTALDCPVLVVRNDSRAAGHDAQRVLLAIAGGDDIATGVRAAAAAAAAPGSKVLVLHVAQAIFGGQDFAYIEPTEEIHATFRAATTMLHDAGISTEAFAAGPGHVAHVVSEAAAGWQADVIVIGSSRLGDLAGAVFGSVTHDLLRTTDRPVLVAERSRAL
jgi:nucleotide-binding universal stress UspA family protein